MYNIYTSTNNNNNNNNPSSNYFKQRDQQDNELRAVSQDSRYDNGISSARTSNPRTKYSKSQHERRESRHNNSASTSNGDYTNERRRSLSSSPVRSYHQASNKQQRPYYNYNTPSHQRKIYGRSKSTSNDLIFVERKGRHANHGHSHKYVPNDFEYKGKLKVKCGSRKIRVPYSVPQWEPTVQQVPILPQQPPQFCENTILTTGSQFQSYDPPHVNRPSFPNYYNGVDGTSHIATDSCEVGGYNSYPKYNTQVPSAYTAGTNGLYDMYHTDSAYQSYYPPIPPGAKIIAQYVRNLDEVYPMSQPAVSIKSTSNYVQQSPEPRPMPPVRNVQYGTSDRIMEKCIPRSKIIEVWKRQRKGSPKSHVSLDSIKKEIVDSITNEIRKLDIGDRYHPVIDSSNKSERDVKVIVQPIQPVFYLPKQQPVQQTVTTIPAQPANPQPAAPSVVYVPRNVYVPVIKPVFVPRERVIVRPQIVQVARPVVIDRPIPVAQRPIVIDRERPVPFPVVQNAPQDFGHLQNEHYIYRDNLPLAYGGRTGEFATGMNYGYVPVDENCQYIVSGCDELLRQQLVGHHHQKQHGYKQQMDQHYDSSGYLSTVGGGDCFDDAMYELGSSSSGIPNVYGRQQVVHHAQHIPVEIVNNQYSGKISGSNDYTTNINIGEENRSALVDTLRRAGTGCANLEVLDPTIKPIWEPVDAKMLIQRYGSSAARFVESDGISNRYQLPGSKHATGSLSNLKISQPKFAESARPYSAEFSPGGEYTHSMYANENNHDASASRRFQQHSSNSNVGYDNEIVNEGGGNYPSMHKQSANSLQIGGFDQWSTPSQYNRGEISTPYGADKSTRTLY